MKRVAIRVRVFRRFSSMSAKLKVEERRIITIINEVDKKSAIKLDISFLISFFKFKSFLLGSILLDNILWMEKI